MENNFDSNGILNLSHYCFDIFCPEFFEFELLNNSLMNNKYNIINLFNKKYLLYKINDQIILNIPFKFLINLNDVEMHDNKIYVKINWSMFVEKIKICDMSNNKITFEILNYFNDFNSAKLFGKITLMETKLRRNLFDPTEESCVQQIMSIKQYVNKLSNNFIFNLVKFNSIIKGLFLESNDIQNNLSHITLSFNDYKRLSYNKFIIKNKCVKINKNMIYLPFNDNQSHDIASFDSFDGSPNFLFFNQVTLEINLSNPSNIVTVYGLYMNILDINPLNNRKSLKFNCEQQSSYIHSVEYYDVDNNKIISRNSSYENLLKSIPSSDNLLKSNNDSPFGFEENNPENKINYII